MVVRTTVARRSGVASSALRFYEEWGLISSERAGSGHRRYSRSVLRRIAFIVFAQRIGLTLEENGSSRPITMRCPKKPPAVMRSTGAYCYVVVFRTIGVSCEKGRSCRMIQYPLRCQHLP
jgi:MerR HTH family regulatory protein